MTAVVHQDGRLFLFRVAAHNHKERLRLRSQSRVNRTHVAEAALHRSRDDWAADAGRMQEAEAVPHGHRRAEARSRFEVDNKQVAAPHNLEVGAGAAHSLDVLEAVRSLNVVEAAHNLEHVEDIRCVEAVRPLWAKARCVPVVGSAHVAVAHNPHATEVGSAQVAVPHDPHAMEVGSVQAAAAAAGQFHGLPNVQMDPAVHMGSCLVYQTVLDCDKLQEAAIWILDAI